MTSAERSEKSFPQRVGAALSELRKARGLSPADLARRCDLTPKELAQYEAGERGMQSDTLGRFLDAMGADLRDLQQALTGALPDSATLNRRSGQGSLIGNSVALNQALQLMRRRRGMNLSEVGTRIGVRKATVSSWESGNAVRLTTLERFFEGLDADFLELHVSLILASLLQVWSATEAEPRLLALVDLLSPVQASPLQGAGVGKPETTLAAVRDLIARLSDDAEN